MACTPRSPCIGSTATLWTCDTPWDWASLLVRLSRSDEREISVRMLARIWEDTPRAKQPEAVQKWVQKNVTYRVDAPPERLRTWLEKLQVGGPGQPFERFDGPGKTLVQGYGDCDDSSRLVRAILRALKFDARLVFLGTKAEPSHVTAAIRKRNGEWYWLDASLAAKAGEHPHAALRRLSHGGMD